MRCMKRRPSSVSSAMERPRASQLGAGALDHAGQRGAEVGGLLVEPPRPPASARIIELDGGAQPALAFYEVRLDGNALQIADGELDAGCGRLSHGGRFVPAPPLAGVARHARAVA